MLQPETNLNEELKDAGLIPFDEYKKEHCDEQANRISVALHEVVPQQIKWLWLNRIPLGKLTMISGDPGLGKSMLTSYLAAQVTRGRAFPGELLAHGETKELGSVIMLSAEDDNADTLVPRLGAADADLSKVRSMNSIIYEGKKHRGLDISKDVSILVEAIESFDDCKLITIDPVSSFLGKVDSNNNSEVRGALTPLTDLAQRYGIAVVCISHLNKGATTKAIYRTMGSLAFVAAARAAFAIAKEEEDEAIRYFCEVKNNLAPKSEPLSYTVSYSDEHSAPYIKWGIERITRSTEEIMNPPTNSHSKKEEAIDFIQKFLHDGSKTVDEVRDACDAEGISFYTIKKHKDDAGVISSRPGGNGPWEWKLK